MVLTARLPLALRGFGMSAPSVWVAVALPLGYFAAASLSIFTFGLNTPVWVSNGLAVTALLRHPRAAWPALLFLAAGADMATNLLTQDDAATGLGIVCCDAFEILAAATALSLSHEAALPFGNVQQMIRFALVCLLVPGVSSAAGAGILTSVQSAPFFAGWRTWYLASSFGLLIVTPLLLSWTDPALRSHHSRLAVARSILLAGLVGIVGYIDFNDSLPGLFLTFPFLFLTTFSGRLLGATTAAAALTAVATWSTLHGHGAIGQVPDMVAQVEGLQLYLVIVLLSTLPIAAVLEHRETLTAQLRESTRAAQAAARAKSDFLAVMSHEIRTPMTGVLGMVDLLMEAKLPAKERGYVTGIRTSGRYLLELINNILDFSRIEAGRLDLETIDFAMADMVEQVRSLLAPQAAARGLELRFECGAEVPAVVKGDPTKLKQVLINLIGNGLKFTRRGGVTVVISRHADGGAQAGTRFEVMDTGVGIAAEQQAALFDVFSQADSSTTRQYGGSGLGLAISKRLVEAMGGRIGVDSLLGVGSRFWFEAPLTAGDAVLAQAAARHPLVAVTPQRVLLVEDVELNQMLVMDMLREHGHEVTLASNGREAVALATMQPFDVILMDVQMPVMDGMEATRRIRALPAPFGRVPVLALSANVMPQDRDRYRAAGMNAALTKPIDWQQLFDAMAHFGHQREAAAPDAAAAGATDVRPQQPTPPAFATADPLADTESPIDAAVLDTLRHLRGGSNDLTASLAELFVRDTGRRLDALRDALHRADGAAAALMAHAIKGSAANLGARIVVQISAAIESSAEAGDLGAASARLGDLQHEFARACDALGSISAVS